MSAPTRNRIPDGHFYSPVVDPEALRAQAVRLWETAQVIHGIDFNDASHARILAEDFPRFIADYDYPEHGPDDDAVTGYYTRNSQFSWLDSRALFVLLRAAPPRKIIEVGCGYSSLLMADVNRRFLSDQVQITHIEPYPRPFMATCLGANRVIRQSVQNVSLDEYGALEAGDILFIDSSHVAKTGSDVNHLVFDVLPILKVGVRIHFHDIFLPEEYPREWVLGEARSWNEQYLLRAFLMDNPNYRVLFGSNYACCRHPHAVIAALNLPSGRGFGGGSFWIEKCGA